MNTRLPLIVLFAVGTVIGVLVHQQHVSSPHADEAARLLETSLKRTLSRSSPIPVSPPPTSSAAGGIKADEIRAMILEIQAGLKAGELADRQRVFASLLPELIRKGPHQAADLVRNQEAGPSREEMLRVLAQHWTTQDPASARRWGEQLPEAGERDAALTDICFQIAQSDPRQATQLADGYGLGGRPGAALENLVQQWAASDVATAAAWVRERPAGEQKDQMLMRVAMVMAETSPAEAARMVADQIPEGGIQTEAAVSVVYQWARRDPDGARAWVELFPEGPLRERALNELKGIGQYQQATK